MDRILKNFYVYTNSSPNPINRWTWQCPELVGKYKMKILMMSMGSNPFSAYQLTINSPQVITTNKQDYSLPPFGYYNPYNLNIDFINFFNVGFTNAQRNRYICGDLVADVMMKGQFDYQHLVFNTTWNTGGSSYLTFDYIINKMLIITAEFTRIKEEVQRGLRPPLTPNQLTNGGMGERRSLRFILNVTSPPNDYFAFSSIYSIFDPRLVGKFRCRLIYNVAITGFPANVGCYLISPQFDLNTPYYFSIGEAQRRDSYGYCPNDYIGTFYGNFNFTVYANRTATIDAIQGACFTWEFEAL